MQAKPIEVVLSDGRRAVITPRVEKVGQYLVPMWNFEKEVRQRLTSHKLPNGELGALRVLAGIPVPGGKVPNAWGENRVHISIGVPLSDLASVRIVGERQGEILVFRGTITGVQISKTQKVQEEFEATARVEEVLQGRFSEKSFSFRMHSPVKFGIKKGERLQIHAKWNGTGYRVDPFKMKKTPKVVSEEDQDSQKRGSPVGPTREPKVP